MLQIILYVLIFLAAVLLAWYLERVLPRLWKRLRARQDRKDG